MKTKSLIAGILLTAVTLLRAATNDLTSALQRGLFEEEANHNLEAAAQAYQAVSARFDQDRKLAATAIFRLGEVYRKQGKTNEATAQYERIVREFADQQTLVTLSRQNLGGLGINAGHRADTQDAVQRQYLEQQATVGELEPLITQLKKLDRHELRRVLPKVSPDPLLTSLLDGMTSAQKAYATLLQNQGESGPLAREQGAKLNQLDKQVEERMDGVIAGLERRLAAAKSLLNRLEARLQPGQPVGVVEPLSKAARLEQKRLLEEEIQLVEKKLESQRQIMSSGRVSQADILTTQQELLALKRQLVAVSDDQSAASNATSPNPAAPVVADDEENEIRRLQAMIQNSPDLINGRGDGTLTPLCQAAERGWLSVATFLLDRGAAIDRSSSYQTPLHYAVSGGHKAMAELLLRRGADANAKDGTGGTALHQAARLGYLSTAEVLVEHKADLNAHNSRMNQEQTPLHVAVEQGFPAMVSFLISKGADVNAQNARGRTPLDLAKPEIAALLRRHGAQEGGPIPGQITVTRRSTGVAVPVFKQGTNSLNHFTLFEVIMALPWAARSVFGGSIDTAAVPFPDFNKVTITRRDPKTGKLAEIPVDVAAALTSGDCSKDFPLEWGDLVNIPDREHKLNEQWQGLPVEVVNSLAKCLERKITVEAKGERQDIILGPIVPNAQREQRSVTRGPAASIVLPFRLKAVLTGSAKLLSTSDLTRVKVRRRDSSTGQTHEWVFNERTNDSAEDDAFAVGRGRRRGFFNEETEDSINDLWVRDGDVIEVPDKP